jgi:hypothetical protein
MSHSRDWEAWRVICQVIMLQMKPFSVFFFVYVERSCLVIVLVINSSWIIEHFAYKIYINFRFFFFSVWWLSNFTFYVSLNFLIYVVWDYLH